MAVSSIAAAIGIGGPPKVIKSPLFPETCSFMNFAMRSTVTVSPCRLKTCAPSRRLICAGDKSSRGIRDVLKISRAAKTNMKRTPEYGRLHCFCRIARQPGITIDAVNSQWAQTDTIDAVIEKVNARVAFVRALEHAVMCGWFTLAVSSSAPSPSFIP